MWNITAEWENIPQMLIAGAAGSCGSVAFGRHKFSNLRIKLACADVVKGPFPIQYNNLFPTYFCGFFSAINLWCESLLNSIWKIDLYYYLPSAEFPFICYSNKTFKELLQISKAEVPLYKSTWSRFNLAAFSLRSFKLINPIRKHIA